MPMVYRFPVLAALKDKGYSSAKLRKDKIMGETAIQSLRDDRPISWANIEKICHLLECQPGDLLEYIPQEATETP